MILFWKVLLVYSIRGCDVKFERFKNGTIRIYSKNWNEYNSANSDKKYYIGLSKLRKHQTEITDYLTNITDYIECNGYTECYDFIGTDLPRDIIKGLTIAATSNVNDDCDHMIPGLVNSQKLLRPATDLKIIGTDDLNMNMQTSIELGWTFPTTHQDIAKHWIQMRHSTSKKNCYRIIKSNFMDFCRGRICEITDANLTVSYNDIKPIFVNRSKICLRDDVYSFEFRIRTEYTDEDSEVFNVNSLIYSQVISLKKPADLATSVVIGLSVFFPILILLMGIGFIFWESRAQRKTDNALKVMYEFKNSKSGDKRLVPIFIDFKRVTLVDRIGGGEFGDVYKGVISNRKRSVFMFLGSKITKMRLRESSHCGLAAIKSVKKEAPPKEHNVFLREASVMAQFDHKNVLKMHGMILVDDDTSSWVCLEFMPGGDLKTFLEKSRPPGWPLSNQASYLVVLDMLQIALDIASGCEYLSSLNVVHRDIAARNCLVSSDTITDIYRVTKLADFGMTRKYAENSDFYIPEEPGLVPVRWMSPESMQQTRFSEKSDVWAFGVTLWEIFNLGMAPYERHNNNEIMDFLGKGFRLTKPLYGSETIYQIMRDCWNPDYNERPTFKSLKEALENTNESEESVR